LRQFVKMAKCFLSLLCTDLFHLIIEYLPNLQDLLKFDTSLSQLPLRELFHSSLINSSIFLNRKFLTSHQIRWLSSRNILISSFIPQKFDQNTVEYLQKFQNSIKNLDLHACNLISNTNLLQILSPDIRYRSLTSLSLAHCNKISNKSLIAALKQNTHLTSLNLSFMTTLSSESVTTLLKYCPHLIELDLSSNLWVTDEGIKILITGCPQLKFINLEKTRITDASIEILMTAYPHLQLLQIANCPITRESISKVMSEIACRSLLSDDPALNLRVLRFFSDSLWNGTIE
jgi:hypothetical protein